ncbi:MAG: lipid-binding SYLF domain-containing protein [Opitutaceae bacterium]|nr:lipid-binding SYLF domain-containing protein [Opitutaceae bacterium]MBP9912234.1 lipid-binding SYLF domain-containing protein [Opitutaceae bacterium]
MKKFFLLSLLASFCVALSARATSRGEAIERIESCEAILQEFQADPATAIPAEILRRARALVIVNQARAGFVLGIKDGYATMLVRRADNTWSVPVILAAGEGSLGFQIGFTKIETIYVITDDQTPRMFFKDRFRVGIDAKAVAGPRFAEQEHIDDHVLLAPVLAYTKNQGLYAGVSIKGGYLSRNDDANRALYDTQYTMPEILYSDWVKPNEDVLPLVNLVRSLTQ